MDAALRILGARPIFRAALAQRLLAKGFAAPEVEAALERAAALGYLDDAGLAAAQATRWLGQGDAPARVAARLGAAGLPEAVATAAVDAAARALGYRPLEAARALLVKRRAAGARAVRLLLARGFDEEVARRAAGFDEA